MDVITAHQYTANHRAVVMASPVCGCFHCLSTFGPTDIQDWVDEDSSGQGQTALCPRCGVDTVIGSKSGVPVEQGSLAELRSYWFGGQQH